MLDVLWETIVRFVGGFGTVAAIRLTAVDRAPCPTEFLARTLKLYVSPAISPIDFVYVSVTPVSATNAKSYAAGEIPVAS